MKSKFVIYGFASLGSLALLAYFLENGDTRHEEPPTPQTQLPQVHKEYAKVTDVDIGYFDEAQANVGHIDIRKINDDVMRFSWVERTPQGWRGKTRTYRASLGQLADTERFSADVPTSHAYYPKIANADEHAGMAVWIDAGLDCGQKIINTRDTNHEGPGYPDNLVYARPYSSATGWGEVSCLNRISGDSYDADVAYNQATGGFVATWVQWDGWVDRVFFSEYDPAKGWGKATLIDAGRADSLSASMKISPQGDVFVSWYALDTLTVGDDTVYYNVKPFGRPWVGAKHLSSVPGLAIAPSVYYSDDRRFNVIWKQYNKLDGYNTLWSSAFDTQGTTLSTGSVVSPENKNVVYDMAHYEFSDGWESLSGSDKLTATVWIQKQGADAKLVLAKKDLYQPRWQIGEVIYETQEKIAFREVRADDSGNMLVTWVQIHDGEQKLFAKIYDAQTELWSEPLRINSDVEAKDGAGGKLKYPPPPQKIVGMKPSTAIVDGKAVILWPEDEQGFLRGRMARFEIMNKKAATL